MSIIENTCRLCFELRRIGFKTLSEHYEELSSVLTTLYIDKNDLICKCVPQHQLHVLCLLRWLRKTGDRPCPQCGVKFQSAFHITRHDSFNLLLRCYFDEWLLSLIWAHLWIGRMVWVTDWPWFLCLLIVPFVNILLQNLWNLFHLSQKSDFELIEFHYQWPQRVTEANHFFSAKIVAQHYVYQKHFQRPINYGVLFDSCSFCGIEVYLKPYMRYVCQCYAYHLDCLIQVIQVNRDRCPNCTERFIYPNRLYLLLRSMPDLIFSQKWQILSLFWNHYPNSPWQRQPCFLSYFFTTRHGFSQLMLFSIALSFYIWTSSFLKIYSLSTMWKVLLWNSENHTCTDPISNSTRADFCFIALLVWFCYEFYRFSKELYLQNSTILPANSSVPKSD